MPPSQLTDLPHTIPPALEQLILQCLAKDPAQRPQDIETVGERLEQIPQPVGLQVAHDPSGRRLAPLPLHPVGEQL